MSKRWDVRGLGMRLLPVWALVASGCTMETMSEGDVATEMEQPVYVKTAARLWTENDWQVPVCFTGTPLPDARTLIQDAVVSRSRTTSCGSLAGRPVRSQFPTTPSGSS